MLVKSGDPIYIAGHMGAPKVPTIDHQPTDATPTMKILFWGVRGSFPVAEAYATGYGGNTPCLEIDAAGQSIIIDAGTGIRGAGQALVARGVEQIDLLLSHTHWDHIQGFPYFSPLDEESVTVRVHGLRHSSQSLHEIFSGQQQAPFSPRPLAKVRAKLEFIEHEDGDQFHLGETKVTCRRLNHPGITAGYRVESGGHVLAYICDTDLDGDVLHVDGLDQAVDDAGWLEQLRQNARDLGHSADVMVCDTFFLPEEFEPLWGHSCPDEFLRLAAEVDAAGIWLFHHRPGRADSDMDGILERYRSAAVAEGVQLHAAREGVEVSL